MGGWFFENICGEGPYLMGFMRDWGEIIGFPINFTLAGGHRLYMIFGVELLGC